MTRTACIVAVGSEMLTPSRLDTNSLLVTDRLNAIGYDIRLKLVAGDDVDELATVFEFALQQADLVVCTGGLGPTEDDLTRDAVARVLKRPLALDESVLERIRARFARRNIPMSAINRRQAMVLDGATVLENANGTAPGLFVEHGDKIVVLLPGPPREMTPILEKVVRDRLAPGAAGAGLFRRVLKITGRTESDVDATVEPIYSGWRNQEIPIITTILAVMGQIELHLTASAPDPASGAAALAAAVSQLEAALGTSIFSTDGRPLEAVVGDLLRQRRWTIAGAESCTGGLMMSRLTDIAGSSDYVAGGVVCYSNASKVEWLGVPEALIAEHGAVSEPVARAMADGVRRRSGSDVGVGITGIAGPGGGTAEKPVGTVAIAVLTATDERVRTYQFIGARDQVKYQSTQAAMNTLRLMLCDSSSPLS